VENRTKPINRHGLREEHRRRRLPDDHRPSARRRDILLESG